MCVTLFLKKNQMSAFYHYYEKKISVKGPLVAKSGTYNFGISIIVNSKLDFKEYFFVSLSFSPVAAF